MRSIGSLCSGIGGLELGVELAGFGYTEWQVEKDPYCQKVLKAQWPHVYRGVDDIHSANLQTLRRVDLIAAGFPCQPASVGGQRKAQEDDRWLWPEVFRVTKELRPRYVFLENVRGLLSVAKGSAFAEVLGDLASLGFDAEWDCFPASFVGAPHVRWRVFVLAWDRNQLANSGSERLEDPKAHEYMARRRPRVRSFYSGNIGAEVRGTESELDRILDGASPGLDVHQWPARRLKYQFPWEPRRIAPERMKHRSDRVKALGNAVVPLHAKKALEILWKRAFS